MTTDSSKCGILSADFCYFLVLLFLFLMWRLHEAENLAERETLVLITLNANSICAIPIII